MRTCRRRFNGAPRRTRRGLTLTELLAASAIMTLIAGALGSLSLAVQSASGYCRGQATAAQHGRIVMHRIEAAVSDATASEQFPGCVVFADVIGGYDFPDTLVVWKPLTTAVDPAGKPRVNELLVFCPDPQKPYRLLELRHTTNTTVTPALSSASSWTSLLTSIKANAASRVELTDRVMTAASTGSGSTSANYRGAVRFDVLMSPSETQWTQYRAGTKAWDDLDWPLDIYGSKVGLRSVACQTELQLLAAEGSGANVSLPFFGSASFQTELYR